MRELPRKKHSLHVNCRFDEDVLVRVDNFARQIGVTRSDMIRNLVSVGLSDAEMLQKFGVLPTALKLMEIKGRFQATIEEYFARQQKVMN